MSMTVDQINTICDARHEILSALNLWRVLSENIFEEVHEPEKMSDIEMYVLISRLPMFMAVANAQWDKMHSALELLSALEEQADAEQQAKREGGVA